MRVLAVSVATIVVIGFSSVLTLRAQGTVCDLKLKIYSYSRVNKPRSRLRNVTVRLSGKGVDQTMNVSPRSTVEGFTGLRARTYELEVSKPGYKTRRKKVVLDCGLQYGDAVWDQTYLWPERKTDFDEADLVEDSNKDSKKLPDEVETGSAEVTKAASEKLFGSVTIEVLIDVDGNVVSASLVSGDKKLAEKAIRAARTAKFSPTILGGEVVRVKGNITYNFVP